MRRVLKGLSFIFVSIITLLLFSTHVYAVESMTILLAQQETEDLNNIRYIAKLENVSNVNAIENIQIDLTLVTTANKTLNSSLYEYTLYSSVKNEPSCSEKENTYYSIYTITNLANYKNYVISATFIINLTDGSKISSNKLTYTIGSTSKLNITSANGYAEGAYIEFGKYNNVESYNVYYKKENSSTYTKIDNELIRTTSTGYRADILGLSKGKYQIKVEAENAFNETTVDVSSYDRSGYAHFNYNTGVGAYNDDGTLKDNAIVVYVNDSNKNTVAATINGKKYTGISEILQNQNGTTPLVIRVLGTINASTWNKLDYNLSSLTPDKVTGVNGEVIPTSQSYYDESQIISNGYNSMSNDIENGITKLNGLTNKMKYDSSKKEFDSYWNMLDIKNAKNVTVEGVGTNAKIFQWGFTFKTCSSIEVRNLTFENNPEDACSFEGPDQSATSISGFTTGHIWLHNNTFLPGVNNWDVCNEQDKHDGDGSTDFKGLANATIAYNHYVKNHKTGLVGSSSTSMDANFTFHHNYYDNCKSRLPYARQANMHMYNNYYYKSTGTNMQIYNNAYAFIEACYFEEANKPMEMKDNGVAKLYNNIFDNCNGTNGGTIVSSRDELVSNSNSFDSSFDTNASNFYYDNINKKSDVEYLTDAIQAKQDCINYAGVLKDGQASTPSTGGSTTPTPSTGTGSTTTPSTTQTTTPSTTQTTTPTPSEPQGSTSDISQIIHNFTTDGNTSTFFTIKGNLSTSKGTVVYNGLTLTKCLKMESSTSITFTLDKEMTLTLVYISADGIKIDGNSSYATSGTGDASNPYILTITLSAGNHEIKKGNSANLFYMSLN